MINFYFFSVYVFAVLMIVIAKAPGNSGCLEREKALALLETAENFLTKAKISFPSCDENATSTNKSQCSGKKPMAYIEIAKKLISNVRQNFPTCLKPIEKEDKLMKYAKPKDCSEILANGHRESGVYTVWPSETNETGKPLDVYCDMETDDGGWTVIQRRGKFPVQQDFDLKWESYKNGFGNLTQEFWLGNENIRVLCHEGCEIRFDLEDKIGEKGFAVYRNFTLSKNDYSITIRGYRGDVGDSMILHYGSKFSTQDKNNVEQAKRLKGGWWFLDIEYYSNLNGIYIPGKYTSGRIFWASWRVSQGLAGTEMKIRPQKNYYK